MSVSKAILIGLLLLFSNLAHGLPTPGKVGMVQYHNNQTNLTQETPPLQRRTRGPDRPSVSSTDVNPTNKIIRRYTAIGDGFAAGVGKDYPPLEGDQDQNCRRSKIGYPNQFVERYGVPLGITNFNFPACQNLQLGDMIASIGMNYSLSPLPRIWYNFGQPDLVSISLGADDDEAIKKLFEKCIKAIYDNHNTPVGHPQCNVVSAEIKEYTYNNQKKYEDFFRLVKTWNLAPGQKREVYVMGFPKPYGFPNTFQREHKFDCPYGHKGRDNFQHQWGMHGTNDVSDNLNKYLKIAADKAGVTFVDVDPKFENHRICDHVHGTVPSYVQIEAANTLVTCSEEKYNSINLGLLPSNSWVQERRGEDIFYPNKKGQAVMAEALAEAVLGVKFSHWEDKDFENDTPGENPDINNVVVPLEWNCPLGHPDCIPE